MKQRAHLSLREGSSPHFCHQPPVPFAMKEVVGKKLDHLESPGIIHKVDCPCTPEQQYNSSLQEQGLSEPTASSGPVQEPTVTSGGQGWISRLKTVPSHVCPVRLTSTLHQRLHFILGPGQLFHGGVLKWTTQVQ